MPIRLPAKPGELTRIISALDEAGATYAIVGEAGFNGDIFQQSSADLDILISPDEEVLAKIPQLFHVLEESVDPVFEQQSFLVETPSGGTLLEFFIATHWLPRNTLRRRIQRAVAGLPSGIQIGSTEDLALLEAAVATHPLEDARERAVDRDDILDLLRKAPTLDVPYLVDNAHHLGQPVVEFLAGCGIDVAWDPALAARHASADAVTAAAATSGGSARHSAPRAW
ncbi:MAG: hypothetical protein ACYDDF_03865 [Thermoplasmatota archaeon]